jgi:hypothetical protein
MELLRIPIFDTDHYVLVQHVGIPQNVTSDARQMDQMT